MGVPQRPGLFGRARNWMSEEREGLTNADRLYAVGGALKDLDWTSGGGHFDAAMARNDQLQQQYEQQQARQQYAEAMQAIFADGRVDPQELGQLPGATFSDYMALQKEAEPETISNAQGIFQIGPDGTVTALERFDRPAPSGFTWDEQGRLAPIPGGPADPAYIERIRPPREGAAPGVMPGWEDFTW